MGPRFGVDAVRKGKPPAHAWKSNLRRSARILVTIMTRLSRLTTTTKIVVVVMMMMMMMIIIVHQSFLKPFVVFATSNGTFTKYS
jgi:hypothetical protein